MSNMKTPTQCPHKSKIRAFPPKGIISLQYLNHAPHIESTEKKHCNRSTRNQRGVIPIQYTIQTATRYRPVWQGPALSLSSVETVLRWSIHQERSQVALRLRAALPHEEFHTPEGP